jgi:hypothetical protein
MQGRIEPVSCRENVGDPLKLWDRHEYLCRYFFFYTIMKK